MSSLLVVVPKRRPQPSQHASLGGAYVRASSSAQANPSSSTGIESSAGLPTMNSSRPSSSTRPSAPEPDSRAQSSAQPFSEGKRVACGRRARRKRLFESHEALQRTFGSDFDNEKYEKFAKMARKAGPQATALIDKKYEGTISIGLPWPVERKHYDATILKDMESFASDRGCKLKITNARLVIVGPEDQRLDIVEVFWNAVNLTEELVGYQYFEELAMPDNWRDLLMDHAPSNWRHLPDLPTCDPAERFNPDQSREYLKGMVSDIVGWVPRVFDKPLTHVLNGLLRTTWDKFKDDGAVLLSHGQDAPEFPRGLRFLLSQAYQQEIPNLDDLGSMNAVLRMVGTDLQNFDECSDTVRFYVTGCESLANELGGEYAWMGEEGNRSQAMDYIPTVLSEKFNMSLTRFVNCLQLKSDKSKVPYGHLGSHPMNMALFLENPRNFVWRLTRYVELWLLFQTNFRYKSGHVVLMEALSPDHCIHMHILLYYYLNYIMILLYYYIVVLSYCCIIVL